jgi:hypothetical protein
LTGLSRDSNTGIAMNRLQPVGTLKPASLFLLCLVPLFLAACTGSSRSNGARLSDAMQKASDDNTGDRTVATRPIYQDNDSSGSLLGEFLGAITVVRDSTSESLNAAPVVKEKSSDVPTQPTWLSLAGGSGVVNSDAIYGLNHIEARLSGYLSQRTRIALIGGIDWSPVQTTSNLSRSLDGGILILNGRAQFNWYTTPQHTFLGQYFFLGGGYNYMMWQYRNSIRVAGRSVGSDALDGVEFFGGVGLNLIQTKHFQLGGEVTPGIMLWFPTTSEGFANDVFSAFPYTKFTMVMSFGG